MTDLPDQLVLAASQLGPHHAALQTRLHEAAAEIRRLADDRDEWRRLWQDEYTRHLRTLEALGRLEAAGIAIALGRKAAGVLDALQAVFGPGGACHGLLADGEDLIEAGVPALIGEVERLKAIGRDGELIAVLEETPND